MMLGIFVKFSSHVIVLQLCKIMSFFFRKMHPEVFR